MTGTDDEHDPHADTAFLRLRQVSLLDQIEALMEHVHTLPDGPERTGYLYKVWWLQNRLAATQRETMDLMGIDPDGAERAMKGHGGEPF